MRRDSAGCSRKSSAAQLCGRLIDARREKPERLRAGPIDCASKTSICKQCCKMVVQHGQFAFDLYYPLQTYSLVRLSWEDWSQGSYASDGPLGLSEGEQNALAEISQ
jgi:hypothetical protein